jgi:hypothetical protein
MSLVYYPIFLILGSVIFYLLAAKNKPEVLQKNKAGSVPGSALLQQSNSHKYSVLVKSNGKLFRSYEGDNVGDLGYLIYTKLIKPDYTHEIYISNNQTNELMRIDKDDDSECMIGVNHPEHGHIGYLPFTYVAPFAE